ANGVAGLEFGELALFLDLGGLLGLELTDDVHWNDSLVLANRQSARLTGSRYRLGKRPFLGKGTGANSRVLVKFPAIGRLCRRTYTTSKTESTSSAVLLRSSDPAEMRILKAAFALEAVAERPVDRDVSGEDDRDLRE